MTERIFYNAGTTAAMKFAENYLQSHGYIFSEVPAKSVTHLLLDVPSRPESIPEGFDDRATIIGGNLGAVPGIDLLQDPEYVSQNANITAHCTVKLLLQHLPFTLRECPVLVIGWGRIGKCLAQLLRNMEARVTVAARNPADRAIANALSYDTLDISDLNYGLIRFRVIINTAPATVISPDALDYCRADCIKIDLASRPGIPGGNVIWARGLPNKEAPETSGILIAKTILRLTDFGKEVSS